MVTSSDIPAVASGDVPAEPATGGAYEQELSRSLKVLGNVMITLSSVTPASSVFIIIPAILLAVGTGSFLALVFSAIVGVFMAFCWAELCAAYPIAGGDYAVVWHAFKGRAKPFAGPVSMVLFALWVDTIVFIPAVIALGTAQYLGVIWSVDTKWAGAIVMLLSAGLAILRVRINAVLTGVMLAIELAALAIVTGLGLANLHTDRFGKLFHGWVLGNGHGGVNAVTIGSILAITSVAVFAYNGYAAPVNLAEETRGSSRGIARAILWSLVITVLAELIPTTAVLLGAPKLDQVTTGSAPMNAFLLATSDSTVNKIVSIGITVAIVNAVIAIVIQFGRVLYSSGRDKAWPGPMNGWMSAISPQTHTPWFATALVGVLGAILCLTVSLNTIIVLTGATLVLNYALVAVGALVGRATGALDRSPYRMPGWPLPPILAIAALAYITTKQTHKSLEVTGLTMLIGLVYWAVVIWPQKGKAWNLRDPIFDEDE
ncbi:MAG TPA: APC family permease [Gaiellaceae bacterium]|nr:APC family permease [Gaiellaceae bacterium]